MAGRYFEEWQVGEKIVHDIRRTVTETDNLMFSAMTHNMQPLHTRIQLRLQGGKNPLLKRGAQP